MPDVISFEEVRCTEDNDFMFDMVENVGDESFLMSNRESLGPPITAKEFGKVGLV
jgi:hypothetical protein